MSVAFEDWRSIAAVVASTSSFPLNTSGWRPDRTPTLDSSVARALRSVHLTLVFPFVFVSYSRGIIYRFITSFSSSYSIPKSGMNCVFSRSSPLQKPHISTAFADWSMSSCISILKFARQGLALHLHVPLPVGLLDPEDVVAADEDLAEVARELLVDVLLGVGQLDVEVAVDGDQAALVLGLAPLEPYYDVLVDAVRGAVLVVYWVCCYVFGHVSSSALEAVK